MYILELVSPELRNRPLWENKLRYKTDHNNMVKMIPPMCWQFNLIFCLRRTTEYRASYRNVISMMPSIAGTGSGKPVNMASLEIVWCELLVDIIPVKIRLELVVFV